MRGFCFGVFHFDIFRRCKTFLPGLIFYLFCHRLQTINYYCLIKFLQLCVKKEERTALGKIKNRALQKIQALRQNEENKARKNLRNKLEELYPSSKPLSVSDTLAASETDAFFH